MARQRQWYEDVMDVALRATLKELGFKRKSHRTYICERSPDRVWTFELDLCRSPAQHFSEHTEIYVQAIEDLLLRHLPKAAGVGRYIKPPPHASTDISGLIEIENGWNQKAWLQDPRSRTWLGGYRRAPSVDTVVRHIRPGGCFSYDAAGSSMGISSQEWFRRVKIVTEELGHDLDMLWRKYELDWLRRCDDSLYFAEWIERNTSPTRNAPARWAVTYHLAGADDRAAAVLRRVVEESEVPYETLVEEIDVQKRGNPRWRWLHGDQGKSREWVESQARAWIIRRKRDADGARTLAAGLAIDL